MGGWEPLHFNLVYSIALIIFLAKIRKCTSMETSIKQGYGEWLTDGDKRI